MIVLWTANTERFCDVRKGLNDTAKSLLSSIKSNEDEVSPSSIFAVASVLEGVSHICEYTYSTVPVNQCAPLSWHSAADSNYGRKCIGVCIIRKSCGIL